MAKIKNIQITFGELVASVYKTAEQFPQAAPHDIARAVSDWTAEGRVKFSNPDAVVDLLQEID